ncbi:MAG: cytochrome c oxidase assembly protein [Alphaproteobacteria bacterium]|nr:cytochrome c oxidase assembly protein [Alphaproteobacteria bacterium]
MRSLGQNVSLALGVLAVLSVFLPIGALERALVEPMARHLLMVAVAAPLLTLGGALDPIRRREWMRTLESPTTAWTIFVAVFAFWLWPAVFRWAAGNEFILTFEYLSILAAALVFWDVALSGDRPLRLCYGARALFLMTAAVATDLPAVLMALAPTANYTTPGEYSVHWGLSTLQYQQFAGLLMWMPANVVFFGFAAFLFTRWLSSEEHGLQGMT